MNTINMKAYTLKKREENESQQITWNYTNYLTFIIYNKMLNYSILLAIFLSKKIEF